LVADQLSDAARPLHVLRRRRWKGVRHVRRIRLVVSGRSEPSGWAWPGERRGGRTPGGLWEAVL